MEGIVINAKSSSILTINGSSSNIKFGRFEVDDPPRRLLRREIGRIGQKQACLRVTGSQSADPISRSVKAPDHASAVELLISYVEGGGGQSADAEVGHRFVHGGPKYWELQGVTLEMLKDLSASRAFDPEHLPNEIRLIEAFSRRFPSVPQIACFDTAFHHDLPLVAMLLSIPCRYEAQGLRRYGFHGLPYAFLLEVLARVAGKQAAKDWVILAHLGSDASLAAVRGGKSGDTTMGLTPAAGVPMSPRSGYLETGLMEYLTRPEQMTPAQFTKMNNFESGLLGISEASADTQELIDRETKDTRAAGTVALFCYQAKKWIGAFADALGSFETLVFSGVIGENAPTIRAPICDDLSFLGIAIDAQSSALIALDTSSVQVCVITPDEVSMIAKSVMTILTHGTTGSSATQAQPTKFPAKPRLMGQP